MMESIEKLRSCGVRSHSIGMRFVDENELQRIADEIEAEIAEAREITRKKHQAERVYWHNEFHEILDAINGQERFWGDCMDYPLPEATMPPSEIAKRMLSERYMLLPVDADGVPIHLYDKLLKSTGAAKPTYGEVVGISDDSVFFNAEQGWESNWSKLTRHVKPRTLEVIVQDAIQYGYSHGKAGMDISEQRDKYADEIRELMGGDAS